MSNFYELSEEDKQIIEDTKEVKLQSISFENNSIYDTKTKSCEYLPLKLSCIIKRLIK